MNKKILILGTAMISLFFSKGFSQTYNSNYHTAIGIKTLDGGGISFKQFLDSKNAVEGIGYFWNQGARITGLYEIHNDILGADGLKWYYGFGGHVAYYNSKNGDGSFLGADGVVGLDYKLKKAPINLALDWQPAFEFGAGRGFIGNWGGLSIRYVLK